MVHSFYFNRNNTKYYFVWDVEGGSLFNVDLPVFLLLKREFEDLNETEIADFNNLDSTIIFEAEEEINKLRAKGLLDVPQQSFDFFTKHTDIKALCLHICHDCNLRCKYCFASDGTYNTERDYMSKEVAKAAIDLLIANSGDRKNLEIDFFGGEPLLNLDVVKFAVDYGRDMARSVGKELTYTMTTNCVLLDDEVRTYLNAEMDNIVLSIDGRKEIHDKLRVTASGTGSFDAIIENAVKMAQDRGDKKHYARGTFTSNNLDFCKDVEFLSDLGFHQISLEPVVLKSDDPLAITKDKLPIIMAEYDKLANLYIDRINTDKWFNFFHFMIDLKNGPCLNKRLTGCGAGCEYLAVSPCGEMFPCHRFVDGDVYNMGNVKNGKFDRDIQKDFSSINVTKKSKCESCFAKYYCSGGCLANSLEYAHSFFEPYSEGCEMTKKRFELSLALYAIENNMVNDDN